MSEADARPFSALAELLLRHRADATTIPALAETLVPKTLDGAYAVQDETVRALGAVGGWKVGPMPEDGGGPICAPLPASAFHAHGVVLPRARLPGLAVEVEVALTLGCALPEIGRPYTPDEARSAIASVHVAFELLASRYADRSAVPVLASTADLQSNAAVILGPAVPAGAMPELARQAMTLSFDGTTVASTFGKTSTANVLRALVWLAGHAAGRGLPLKAGDVVITGARLGPLDFGGRDALAEAPGLGAVHLALDPGSLPDIDVAARDRA